MDFPLRYSRNILALGCVLLTLWVLISVWHAIWTTDDQIKIVSFNSYRDVALQMMRSEVDRLFQMGILIVAGLLSVAVVKKDTRLQPTDVPTVVMFACAMVLFGCFFYLSQQYTRIVEWLYWDVAALLGDKGEFVDVFDSPYINLHHEGVIQTFYGALIVSGLTLFTLCLLRREK